MDSAPSTLSPSSGSTIDYSDLLPSTRRNIARARSLDHPDLLGDPLIDFRLSYDNIGDLLLRQADEHGDRVWITFIDNEHTGPTDVSEHSYHDMLARVVKTSRILQGMSLRPGDTVATVDLFNHVDTVVILLAAWSLGLRVAPINMEEDAARIQFILKDSRAKAAFVRDSHVVTFAPIAAAAGVTTCIQLGGLRRQHGQDWPLFDTLVQGALPDVTLPPVPLDQEALLVYTSGTTGNPKGVLLAHEMLYDVDGVVRFHGFDEGDVFLTAMRLFHVNAIITSMLASLFAGGRLVLMRRWKPAEFWATVAEEGVTTTSVVPAMLADLSRLREDLAQYPTVRETLRAVICGAGTLKRVVADDWLDWTGIRIAHGWGMSETTCWGCWLPHDLPPEEYRALMLDHEAPSIGMPLAHNLMGIHDSAGKALPAGEKGQIVVAGRNIMARYFQRPDANDDTFKFGVLETGDEGFWTPDAKGRPMFFITGRLKDIIERGGEKYSPYLMDDELSRVPGVASALVFGFPHDRLGQEVGVVLEVQAGRGNDVTLETVQRFCLAAGWSWAKTPKQLRVVPKLPKTSTGKDTRKAFGQLFEGCGGKHYPKPEWFRA